ncbi:MAG: phosphotransferase [Halioglobus sp.]|nr:phosphotransferase [Halioglobus sp.]
MSVPFHQSGVSTMIDAFPHDPEKLTSNHLTCLIRRVRPDLEVVGFSVYESKVFGGNEVSTACRIGVDVELVGEGAAKVASRWMIKTVRPDFGDIPLYRNEVEFYTRLRPELDIETPACFGGDHYAGTGTFGIAMEDLRQRGVHFANVNSKVSLDHVRSLLSLLAELHAAYWASPRFVADLAWLHPHTSGDIYTLFNHPDMVPAMIAREIAENQFKRELVESVGQSAERLYREFRKLQRHQSTLPQTLCHGDTHIGNSYLFEDGRAGLLDWQLMAKGYCMHDVTYLLATALGVADRRRHEGALLEFYREQLQGAGVEDAPDSETLWLEYRRAIVWGVYIGWLTTPVENYGWDITVNNHIRLLTAYRDLDCSAALADLPEAKDYKDEAAT